jgi:hypothetical protein
VTLPPNSPITLLRSKKLRSWIALLATYHSLQKTAKGYKAWIQGEGHFSLPNSDITESITIPCPDIHDTWAFKAFLTTYGSIPGHQVYSHQTPSIDASTPTLVAAIKGIPYSPTFEKEFESHFGTQPHRFASYLALHFGHWMFDIVHFNSWLRRHLGYREEKDGSLQNFIQNKCGETFLLLFQHFLVPHSQQNSQSPTHVPQN